MMKQQGIVTPIITPLRGPDELDPEGLERLLERLLDGGVDGIFPLGSTGEAPSLSPRLRRELVGRVIRWVGGRAPVWVGVTDTCFSQTRERARTAADAGAAGVVLTAPYYYPISPDELAPALERLIRDLPLPVMLYNIPACTQVWFDLATLRRLAALDNVVGIKDSGGDLDYFTQLLTLREHRPDWCVLMGPARLLVEAMRRGADGGVCAASHLSPRLLMECWRAMVRGDEAQAEQMQSLIVEVTDAAKVGSGFSGSIRGLKCALSLWGVCEDCMAEPFEAAGAEARARVRSALDALAGRLAPYASDPLASRKLE